MYGIKQSLNQGLIIFKVFDNTDTEILVTLKKGVTYLLHIQPYYK